MAATILIIDDEIHVRRLTARMLEVAGEHIQFLAFHGMFNPDAEEPVLAGELYRRVGAECHGKLDQGRRQHRQRHCL